MAKLIIAAVYTGPPHQLASHESQCFPVTAGTGAYLYSDQPEEPEKNRAAGTSDALAAEYDLAAADLRLAGDQARRVTLRRHCDAGHLCRVRLSLGRAQDNNRDNTDICSRRNKGSCDSDHGNFGDNYRKSRMSSCIQDQDAKSRKARNMASGHRRSRGSGHTVEQRKPHQNRYWRALRRKRDIGAAVLRLQTLRKRDSRRPPPHHKRRRLFHSMRHTRQA